VVQQHQGEQAGDLGLLARAGQLAGQADRLRRQVELTRVALVEDQVEHLEHRAEVAWHADLHVADGPLRPADPLRHRRLGHQVGLGDLPRGESAHRTEGERHGRSRGQRRVAAQEEQQEGVVAVLRRPRRRLLHLGDLAALPRRVRAPYVEEAPPGDGHQPALRLGRQLVGPAAYRLDERLLDGVLGRREVGSATDEDAEDLRAQVPQQPLDGTRHRSVSP
jgi:hypothetical protein